MPTAAAVAAKIPPGECNCGCCTGFVIKNEICASDMNVQAQAWLQKLHSCNNNNNNNECSYSDKQR